MPAMIELLGVGAPRQDGGWMLHRVCAQFRRGEVTLVVSRLPEERDALLDAVAARIVPEEGRVWGRGGREVETASGLGSIDKARLALAGALVKPREALVMREIDRGLDGAEAAVVRGLLQPLARRERLVILASAATPAAASGFADRLVAIADGLLVFDGPPADFSGERAAWRFGPARPPRPAPRTFYLST